MEGDESEREIGKMEGDVCVCERERERGMEGLA
jgi:hypothetical protein